VWCVFPVVGNGYDAQTYIRRRSRMIFVLVREARDTKREVNFK